MPRNTVNSHQTTKTTTTTNDQGPSKSRRRLSSSKRVSFADEQNDTTAIITQQKKKQEKLRIAQIKTKTITDRATLKKQKETIKRHEKKKIKRHKEQKKHVARLKIKIKTLRREKKLEKQRVTITRHEQELYVIVVTRYEQKLYAVVIREKEKWTTMQRDIKMITEKLLNETELKKSYSPRTLTTMKRDEKLKNEPYKYSVKAVLRVQNESQTPTKWSNKIEDLHVKEKFDIHALNIDLDAAIEQHDVNELNEIREWIKSTHFKKTRQTFTLNIISIEQWEQRIESIITIEWQKRFNFILDIKLICTDRIGLKRDIQIVDGPAQSPSHRRTRTNNLEDQHAVVRDRQKTLDDHLEQLIIKWKCQSTSCEYKDICWIDENDEHYKMNAVTRERWAVAIQDDQVTQYQPPLLVYKTFMNTNSNANDDNQKKKTSMKQMKIMMKQQMKLGLLKNMKSITNIISEESQSSHFQQFYQFSSYQLSSYQPPSSFIYPFSSFQYFEISSPSPSSPSSSPPLFIIKVSRTKTSPPQRSNFIGARIEKKNIIDRF